MCRLELWSRYLSELSPTVHAVRRQSFVAPPRTMSGAQLYHFVLAKLDSFPPTAPRPQWPGPNDPVPAEAPSPSRRYSPSDPLTCICTAPINRPLHTTHLAYLLETGATPSVDSLCHPPILKVQAFLTRLPCSTQPLKKRQLSIIPQIEKLLTEQTSVILQAVDEKLSAQDKRMEEKFIAQEIRILAAVDKRLAKMEERFAKSLDELTKTIDKFLKRLTDIEEEFTFMKEDLKRVKTVLREKLGVSLD